MLRLVTPAHFSFTAQQAPGMFFLLGASRDPEHAAPNHSPYFELDEAALIVGVRALAALASEFLSAK